MKFNPRILENLKSKVKRALDSIISSIGKGDMTIPVCPMVALNLDAPEWQTLYELITTACDVSKPAVNYNNYSFVYIKGTGFGNIAYFDNDGEFSPYVLDCKVFNNPEDAKAAMDSESLKSAAEIFCKDNHWTLTEMNISSCSKNLSEQKYTLSLSALDLDYLRSKFKGEEYEFSSYGNEDGVYYIKAYNNIIKQLNPIFRKNGISVLKD